MSRKYGEKGQVTEQDIAGGPVAIDGLCDAVTLWKSSQKRLCN